MSNLTSPNKKQSTRILPASSSILTVQTKTLLAMTPALSTAPTKQSLQNLHQYHRSPSVPQVSIQILLKKFSKHIDAIAYFDTDCHNTMMNPNILPPATLKSQTSYFKAADGKIYTTNLISKNKIGIKIFPSYTIWTQVLDTSLPDKDILIGWDVYCQCKSLCILPSGIRYKRDFKSFSHIHKIFPLSEIQPPFQVIQQKLFQLCTNSHVEFTHPSPPWKNPEFFVHLPFKLNEDVNPTKATYEGHLRRPPTLACPHLVSSWLQNNVMNCSTKA
ncbi:hypothetical protein Dsin_024079 [Dipteronia sinensis]|uniref:Uncharacterized protein n=1 Tax=Dipteronia sinensis TaxID=43782 RepID=A0AAE0E1P1_9ROSI|nr:hypothetical protein Dsin_024079 [Dipteronia sinensis]